LIIAVDRCELSINGGVLMDAEEEMTEEYPELHVVTARDS
jgi:hypothetical protein